MTFTPSRYQSAIFSFIDSGNGHAVVDAVPGSGKTTTLLYASDRLPKDAKGIFLAFNKIIAEELDRKLRERGAPMTGSTIHSLGKSFLGSTRVEKGKYRDIAKSALLPYMEALKPSVYSFGALCSKLHELVDFVRQTLTEPKEAALMALANHYDLDVDYRDVSWPYLWQAVKQCLEDGKAMYQTARIIDFTDMIYLPVALGVSCKQYDYVFVDEAQDLNKCELELVTRICLKGRIIAVGDKRQSMYGFAGADTRSIENIIERLNATVLPLSICYRCPPNITRLASQVWSGIEPCEKEDGAIAVVDPNDFMQRVQQAMEASKESKYPVIVLGRINAPLVSECLRFLRAGIKAQVRGKDLGKKFSDLVKKLQFRMGFALETLGRLVEDYRRQEIAAKVNVPDSEMAIAEINDKVDTFVALYGAYLGQAQGNGSIAGFMTYLEDFFTDDLGNGTKPVIFSTIHKAKGLEYDNVFILATDKLPHPMAKKPWQMEQEYNIEYVAITRAIKALYFVDRLVSNLTIDQQPAMQPFITVQEVQVSDLLGDYTAYIANEREPAYDFSGIAKFAEAVNKHAILFQNAERFNAKHEPGALDIGADCERGRHVDCMRRNCQCECHKPEQPRTVTLALPETIMTENATAKTWVQPPKANVTQKVGRKPVDHSHGRKPMDGKTPKTYIQLSIPTEMYERIAAMKAAGEIESASALFEALFKARY